MKEMGGLEVWKRATTKEKLATFAKHFDQYSLDGATASLWPMAYAVPLQHILSDNTPLHSKWQRFHRTVFLLACEVTFQLRLATIPPQIWSVKRIDFCYGHAMAVPYGQADPPENLGLEISSLKVVWGHECGFLSDRFVAFQNSFSSAIIFPPIKVL